jgi:hypothetical protein
MTSANARNDLPEPGHCIRCDKPATQTKKLTEAGAVVELCDHCASVWESGYSDKDE